MLMSDSWQQFALTAIKDGMAAFAGYPKMCSQSIESLKVTHDQAIESLTKDLTTLLDAFDFTEYETDSIFDRNDLDPYEGLLRNAQLSTLR